MLKYLYSFSNFYQGVDHKKYVSFEMSYSFYYSLVHSLSSMHPFICCFFKWLFLLVGLTHPMFTMLKPTKLSLEDESASLKAINQKTGQQLNLFHVKGA